MEDFVKEIIKEVVVSLTAKAITPVVSREWEEGWDRDYKAGGLSYQELKEELDCV